MAAWNDEVLFIHIPKTAGISIRQYLKDFGLSEYHDLRKNGAAGFDHIPLRDVEQITGRDPCSFERIIVVIRDPYEQTLSQWWHWRDGYARGGRTEVEYEAAMNPTIGAWLSQPYSDYPTYYEAVLLPRYLRNEPAPQTFREILARSTARTLSYYQWWIAAADGSMPDEWSSRLVVIPFHLVSTRVPAALEGLLRQDATPELTVRNTSRKRDALQYYDWLSCDLVENRFRWSFGEGLFTPWVRE